MNQAVNGFKVTMHLWVEEANTGRTLLTPQAKSYQIQPPTWCHDDPIELEMHLDHLAKLQFLYEIRRTCRVPGSQYASLIGRQDYMVRGFMKLYEYPADKHGQVRSVAFDPMNLRIA